MKTLSIPHNSSAEGPYFCPRSGSSPEQQAEELPLSMSKADAEFYRAVNHIMWFGIVAGCVLGWLICAYPRIALAVIGTLVSAIAITGIYWWATCRGNTEIGVSDTQGRDTNNTNS